MSPAPQDTILVVDDEPQIRRVLRHALENDATRVVEAANGQQGVDLAAAMHPTMIILDLGLPDLQGQEVCREVRHWSTVPILVLSARHSDQEKVTLLDAGADDYMTKPFNPAELQARVRALLRRSRLLPSALGEQVVEAGEVTIDLVKPALRRAGQPVHLTKTEWDILRTLVRHGGRTLTHQQLFRAVWGNAQGDMQGYLRVHIRSLRRKIETDPVRPALIVTEPGVGYRFEPVP